MLVCLPLLQNSRVCLPATPIDDLICAQLLDPRWQFLWTAPVRRDWTASLLDGRLLRFLLRLLLLLVLDNCFIVSRGALRVEVGHYFQVLLDKLCIPLIEDDSCQIAHHLPVFLVNCLIECLGHGVVRLAEPYEVSFVHEIALSALAIGPKTILICLLPSVCLVVAKNFPTTVDAHPDVLVSVKLVVFEGIQRVALL